MLWNRGSSACLSPLVTIVWHLSTGKMPLWELWIHVEDCETLVQSKIKEICFEKAGLHLGG